LAAQVARLESLTSNNNDRSPSQTKEAEQVANSILLKIRHMTLRRIKISFDVRVYEAYAYEILGCMIVEAGDQEKYTEALKLLEKSLEVSMANNHHDAVVTTKGLIAVTKTKIGQGAKVSLLKQTERMYEQALRISKTSVGSIKSGLGYIDVLKNHHHGVKAERLLSELDNISLQNHGADHVITKAIGYRKDIYMCRAVSITSNEVGDYQSFQALSFREYNQDLVPASRYRFIEYDGCFEKCIVKDGPKTLSLSTDDIIFALGTPVICHDKNSDITADLGDRIYCEEAEFYTIRNLIGENGVPRLGDIRSWNIETQCYTIYWEDESIEPRIVHRSKVIVPSRFGNDRIIIPLQTEVYFHTTE